ncbi:MAG: SDR family oxidoreductase [Frankiaceae bacterium]|nr:SDR family oxidoreductase [Frankiaceae bacterium]MBV9873057.1 SDR family oxidoreductase [Frankiaceae bacterium]
MARPFDFSGKHVVVTGAASGIGRATAEALASRGARLHLTDRDRPKLLEVAAAIGDAGGAVGCVAAFDIRDLDQAKAFAAKVHATVPQVDAVMNIAGVSAWGSVERLEHHHWRDMVDINLMGPIHMIEAFVPAMVAGGRGGRLVNVSSAAGLFGLPWHAAYSASKFGLRGVSEVLRFDLARHDIAVSLVCPGGVDTPLTATVQVAGVDTSGAAFAKLQGRFRRHAVTPEQAAAAIVRGAERGRYLVFTSPDIRALYHLQRLAPHTYAVGMRMANRAFVRAMKPALS